MKPRVLILPIAALIIAALVQWRYQREPGHWSAPATSQTRQLAPRFALYDQHSQLVKFERYLGRTRLLVVFLAGEQSLEKNPLLQRLRDVHPALEDAGVQVVAIGQATPHAIRQAEQRSGVEFPFPVLTDIDMNSPIPVPVHRMWGLADDDTPAVRTGVFFVDRRGTVEVDGAWPRPLDDPQRFVDGLTGVVDEDRNANSASTTLQPSDRG